MTESEQYWTERTAALEALVDYESRITAGELAKVYDSALSRIEQDIRKIFHAYTRGYGVSPGEAKKLLSQAQSREVREKLLTLLNETNDPLLQQSLRAMLDAPAYAYRISKLDALRAEVFADAAAVGLEEILLDKARLADVYRESYYRSIFDISQQVGANVPFQKLSNRQTAAAIEKLWSPSVGALAQNYSQRVWGNTHALAENVREIVTRGVMTGATYEDMIGELSAAMGAVTARKRIGPDSKSRPILTGTGAKYRAARLIRTEANYISGQARMMAYQDAGIERYIYRAYLELKTCERCGELDGQVFPVSEQVPGKNMHPLHPHCFCYECPYMDKEQLERLQRAAEIAPGEKALLPLSMTYTQWREMYVDGSPEMQQAAIALRRKKKPETVDVENAKWNQKQEPFKVVPKRWADIEGG